MSPEEEKLPYGRHYGEFDLVEQGVSYDVSMDLKVWISTGKFKKMVCRLHDSDMDNQITIDLVEEMPKLLSILGKVLMEEKGLGPETIDKYLKGQYREG